MNEETKFLIDVITKASKLITPEFEVKVKDDEGNLVTNFDLEIESYISGEIRKHYLNFDIVSEEFNSKKSLTDNCFTLDPIDGTVNFANNIPLWSIQAACIKDGKTCACVIYIPKLNELYYANENGAFLNGNPIHVNNLNTENGLYSIEGPKNKFKILDPSLIKARYRITGASSVAFAWVACGKLSAFNCMHTTLWDHIPGMYLVKMAGGILYNKEKCHIAANSKEFIDIIKTN